LAPGSLSAADAPPAAAEGSEDPKVEEAAGEAEAFADIAEDAAEDAKKSE
jgi:hypothetical protein